jgi:hypothetical protein
MKEFLAAAVLIGSVAYFWFNASPEPPPELRERHRPVAATVVTPANNPTGSLGSIGVPPNTDGSLASRWKTGPSGQTNLTPTISDRWKTGPNAQTDLTGTPPDRWKPGPK